MTAQAAASTSARDGIATSASTSSTKRRKNAPSKLPELDDSEEPSILVKLRPGKSGIRIDAPGTPYDEISLTSAFITGLRKGKAPQIPLHHKRRAFFVGGGVLGALLSYGAFIATRSYHAGIFSELESTFGNFEFGFPTTGLSALGSFTDSWSDLGNMLNMSDLIAPNARKWLENRDFKVGRELKAAGHTKHHSVILIPGVISTGLESWGTDADTAQFFRKRVWGGGSMVQAIVTRKKEWLKAVALDPQTGLDPPGGIKVRAAQGLDAASYFVTGYWIWSKIIEMAAIDYDYNVSLQAYDWRLSYINLQKRDAYFSRMKGAIEHNRNILGKRTVLVSHSMGGTVLLWFLKWVEAEGYGGGGTDWVEKHVAAWVNIGGCMLGVPKAMAAFMSGEMRDTVELNPAGAYLLEKLFSKKERATLFRTWAGSASMLLKGGDAVWGDDDGAPDDPVGFNLSSSKMFRFKAPATGAEDFNSETVRPNLTLSGAIDYLKEHTSRSWHEMVRTNYSLGIERDVKQLQRNNLDHTKWSNPLEVQLPLAPSMKIYCLYGFGKPTERAYFYSKAETGDHTEATEDSRESGYTPHKVSWIDSSINFDNLVPSVKAGVVNSDGDGTVPLLSSGAMCVEGWKRKLYNPAGIQVVTHELEHKPLNFDPRGGPTTADHIDALGTTIVNEAVLQVASGKGHLVNDTVLSPIREYAKKIRWDG